MITIFTPTYNREQTLGRLYESLVKQEFDDFEWIIVDDASTDNTASLVSKFEEEKKVNIRYYKVKNGGKQRAFNFAVSNANGECFVCVDSDDYLADNVLERISKEFDKIKNDEKIAGLGFLVKKHGTEKIVGTSYPKNNMVETYTDIYYKFGVQGDKQLIYKTEILKEFPFPVENGERFVPEAIVFNRIAKKYKMKFINFAVTYVEYREDGYSANYFELVKKNPKGNMQYLKELYEIEPSLYNVAAYDLFGMFAKMSFFDIIGGHPSKIKALIMYIPAILKYIQKR